MGPEFVGISCISWILFHTVSYLKTKKRLYLFNIILPVIVLTLYMPGFNFKDRTKEIVIFSGVGLNLLFLFLLGYINNKTTKKSQ